MPGTSLIPVSLQSKLQKAQTQSALKTVRASLYILRNLVFLIFLLRITRQSFYFLRGYGLVGSIAQLYHGLHKRAYQLFFSLPPVRSQVKKQVAVAKKQLEDKIAPDVPGMNRYLAIPKEPWTPEQLRSELESLTKLKRTRWEEGKVSGAVYHGGGELADIQMDAMKRFLVSNPIHADVFPAVRKMEAEVVAMVSGMFNAPTTGCGVTTSGGTESILMACLAARNMARSERGVTEPEIIVPSTAHAAFHKAAGYFKMTLRIIDCPSPEYKVPIHRVRRMINPNTVLLVGSAPNYPHGIVDNIPDLSKLAVRRKLPLHVDCCLGSFVIATTALAGLPSPYADAGGFDFRQPGVTSISVDTHKYGFAPKGNSVVLYRSPALRKYQYFLSPDWTGGVYGSPSIAGSRPGALVAGTWATMMSVGEKGYVDATHKIITARITIQNAIKEHPVLKSALKVIGEPMLSVVAFDSVDPAISIYDIADAMGKKDWHLNSLQDPPGLHVCVTLPMTQADAIDQLIEDLIAVVTEEKEKIVERVKAGGSIESAKEKQGRNAQLYGVAGSMPDKSIVNELLTAYLDTLYKA